MPFSYRLIRRTPLAAVAAGTALLPLNASAQAAWPNRPIELIVPFAAGGGGDVIARAIANKFGARRAAPQSRQPFNQQILKANNEYP